VTVRLRSRTPEDEAHEIANANYEQLKEEVLRAVNAQLRKKQITTVNRQDLEIAYSEAWQGTTQWIIQRRPVTSLAGLVYKMTYRRAFDIYRAKQERRRVDLDLEMQSVEPDYAQRVHDHDKLTGVLGRLKDRLSEKERRAVTLCVLHGYKRPEAADLLKIDRAAFERIMDGAMKKMGNIVASLEARGHDGDGEWSRLMRAYALGLLSEEEPDYKRALEHLEGDDPCESCRRYVRGLRGLAAVMPPLLPPGLLGGHEPAILSHLYQWLGGHATAAAQAGAAAGAGAGGTAAGIAVGGGAKAIVLAGAAALSIAGAAVVVSQHVASAHHRTPLPSAGPALVRPVSNLQDAAGVFAGPAVPRVHRTTSLGRGRQPARGRAALEFHPAAKKHLRPPPREFTFEGERATSTQSSVTEARAAKATSPSVPSTATPPPAHATPRAPASNKEGESREFQFEENG
jgi:DNA-directed RNA polymerase specialized sigma24 family protein